MTFSDLKQKPVVSMVEGVKVGEVSDLILDPASWSVTDLVLDGKQGKGLFPLSRVKGIGPDAVTVERSDEVAYNVKPSGLSFESLKTLHVVDGTGTRRGQIAEFTYSSDGKVEAFQVAQGGVLGIGVHRLNVAPAEIRGVGDKILTVDAPPAE